MYIPSITRRDILGLLSAGLGLGFMRNSLHAQAASTIVPDASSALKAGGCVLLLRHAQTEPGVGDPPGFRLNACSTQRNLNEQGVAQAQQIAAWFARLQLTPRAVKTSQWCRTRDTARHAFGRYTDWPALNNFFEQREREPTQTALLQAALKRLPNKKALKSGSHMA